MICTCSDRQKMCITQHACSHPKLNKVMLCLLVLLFEVYLMLFWGWFCFLKWPPNVVWKCCLAFLNSTCMVCFIEKNVCYVGFVQAWVLVLLALSSMLMTQQYILNKASLNRNIREQDCILIVWWKCCDQRLAGTEPFIFPRSIGPLFLFQSLLLYRT